MAQQGLPTDSWFTAMDGTSLPTYLQSDDFHEEVTRDDLSSEAWTQQVNTWSDQTPSQAQYSSRLLSRPGQFDLGAFAGWEDFLAADHMAAPMPLQAANDTSFGDSCFQAPASDRAVLMYSNALQPRHGFAGQHTHLDLDANRDHSLGHTPITVGGYIPYHDPGWQPSNFETIQEPTSMLVPYDPSTHSLTTLSIHPTMMNPAPFEPSQIPQISDISASGLLDFAEIDRQARQSSEYGVWQLMAQTNGPSFDSTSLDAPPILLPSEVGDLSTQDSSLTATDRMVLPMRSRGSAAPAIARLHLTIAPRPLVTEIAPAPPIQAHTLVPSAVLSRKLSAQPISKLTTKTTWGPCRPIKHRKHPRPGALESMPGYYAYPLEPLNTVKKHNSRYDKKRGSSEDLARKVGACILCRHHKKECIWSSPNMPCSRCIKTIQDGGTQISGVKITACLTNFQDLLTGARSSQVSRGLWEAIHAGRILAPEFTTEGKPCLVKSATMLDWICDKKVWRNFTTAVAVAAAKGLMSLCSALSRLRYEGLDGRLTELMIHYAALLCSNLPQEARYHIARCSLQQISDLCSGLTGPTSISDDAQRLQHPAEHYRYTVKQTIVNSAIVLQLAKALNTNGDVIGSDILHGVRQIFRTTQQLSIFLGDPLVKFY